MIQSGVDRALFFGIVLALALGIASCVGSDTKMGKQNGDTADLWEAMGDPFYGHRPADDVRDWIGLYNLALPNHPWQIVLISPYSFKTRGESLLVLPEAQYLIVASSLPGHACMSKEQASHAKGYLVEKVERRGGDYQDACLLSKDDACAVLQKIRTLSAVNWTSDQVASLESFGRDEGCAPSIT